MFNSKFKIFNIFVILLLAFVFVGCGYKSDPIYIKKSKN